MQPSDIQSVPASRNGHHSGESQVPNAAVQRSGQVGRDLGCENTTDPVIRQRYKNGSTRTRRFACDEPLSDGERLRDTPLRGLLEELSRISPAAASYIEWFHDHVLLNERNQLLLLRLEEEAKRQVAADRAEACNSELEAKKEQVRQGSETELAATRSEVRSVEDLVHNAHRAAATPAALAGGVYDPEHPESACLRHSPQPLGVVMGRAGLPWVEGDARVFLPAWLGWIVTILVGALFGISLGMLCHSLHPDSLDRTPGLTLGWIAAGFAVAVGFKYGSKYAWYVAAQYCYSQLRQRRWLPAILTAILLTATLVVTDAMTTLQGLLAMVSQDAGVSNLSGSLSHSNSVPVAMYLVSLVVASGLIACSSYEGYLLGRRFEMHNRGLALQYDEFATRDQQIRTDPKTIAALIGSNDARVLMSHKASLEAAASERENRRDRALSELDSRRMPACDELSDRAALRIEDQRDNFQGAMRFLNHLFFCAFPRIFRRRWWR